MLKLEIPHYLKVREIPNYFKHGYPGIAIILHWHFLPPVYEVRWEVMFSQVCIFTFPLIWNL